MWTGVCLTFVFGALLEYALVNYTSRKDKHRAAVIKQRKQWDADQQRFQQGKSPTYYGAGDCNHPITALVSYLHKYGNFAV